MLLQFLCFTDGNADAYDDRHGQQFVGANESMTVWGAQVEGLVMNDYIPTGSTISVRYENGDLLLEEARTILINSDLESQFQLPISVLVISDSICQYGRPSGLSTTTAPDGESASKLALLMDMSETQGQYL